MTHSFFSDVIRIESTENDPQEYTQLLSNKAPGEYTLVYSIACIEPHKVKLQIKKYLNAQQYIDEFYQVSPELAKKLLKRETLKIPIIIK